MKCPNCGKELADNVKFCAGCGTKMSATPKKKFCSGCGVELTADTKFCSKCGKRTAPEVPAAPAAEPPKSEEKAPESPKKRFCAGCGKELPDGKKFCTHCGLPAGAKPNTKSEAQPAPPKKVVPVPVSAPKTEEKPAEPIKEPETKPTETKPAESEAPAAPSPAEPPKAETASPQAPKKRFCAGCGKELPEGRKFCTHCGLPAGSKPVSAQVQPDIPKTPHKPAKAPKPKKQSKPLGEILSSPLSQKIMFIAGLSLAGIAVLILIIKLFFANVPYTSVPLQIALGLLPAALCFAVLLLMKKGSTIRNALSTAVVSLVVAVLALCAVGTPAEKEVTFSGEAAMRTVYSLLSQEQTELASDMLSQIRTENNISNEMTLCTARIKVLEGNYKAADALYEKLGSSAPENEAEAVNAAYEDSLIDYSLLAYSADYAEMTGANFAQQGAAATKAQETVKDAINAKFTDINNESAQTAEIIAVSSRLYEDYLASGYADETELINCLDMVANLESRNSEMFNVDYLRIARLKLYILNEDYTAIARSMDENTSYEEYLIISELGLNGYISAEDYNSEYISESLAKYNSVADALGKILSKRSSKLDSQPRLTAARLHARIERGLAHPEYNIIIDELLSYTYENDSYDSSKVYMQIAKIEDYLGVTELAEEHITDSFENVGYCEDDSFTRPMYDLIDIITDKDDTESLKDVADYVDRVLTNTTTIELDEDLHENQNEEENTASFENSLTEYVSKKRTSVNISSVDASGFETVKATITVDGGEDMTIDELKAALSIEDCGAKITDFDIRKIDVDGANILLCCDCSDSMSGSAINELKEAVRMFIENSSYKESIALVVFNDGIADAYTFGTPKENLLAAVDAIYDHGGTNMFDAMIESVDMFPAASADINSIILMSDGRDGNSYTGDHVSSYISIPAAEEGITIYSIGLGPNVNSEYLDAFASPTGGEYLYAHNSESLTAFFEYLHDQILNQYEITFTAQDTLTFNRTLTVTLNTDSLSSDSYNYTLDGSLSEDTDEETLIKLYNRSVSGFDTRLLYKSGKERTIRLIGTGFLEDDSVTVSLEGNLDYGSDVIKCEYESDTSVRVTIPAGIACGTYNARVSVNGKTAVIDDALTVVTQGSEQLTSFGPYVFTSYTKVKDGDTLTLSDYVSLNGWLAFNGDVELRGDLNSSYIRMTDNEGSYITYYEGTATGLAKSFAEDHKVVNVPAMGMLTLYNDQLHFPTDDNYQTEATVVPALTVSGLMKFSTPGLRLYPDRIVIDCNEFDTDFINQGDLLKSAGFTKLFNFSIEFNALLTSKNIGFELEVDTTNDDKNYSQINMGNSPIYVSPANFKISINTIKNEYYLKYLVKLLFLDSDGIGFSIKLGEGLKLTEVGLYADIDVTGNISGVPVTFSDFKIMIADFDASPIPALWTFTGSMDISAAKVSAVYPGLEAYVGDVSFAKLDDIAVKFSLKDMYIKFSATGKLFEEITIGAVEIEAGKLTLTNTLLGMKNDTAYGLRAQFKRGLEWKCENISLESTGTVEFTITNQLLGVRLNGKVGYELDWWVFSAGDAAEADGIIGVSRDHSGKYGFVFKLVTTHDSKGWFTVGDEKKETTTVHLTWSKGEGLDCGIETL